ncbi:MAG TPA: choline kinase family protein [Ktedonobacteraceae bacterium]
MSEQSEHFENILNLVPEWDEHKVAVIPLAGGITNQNYRVDIGSESFVLRVGGKGTHLLGIDRAHERACTAIAAELGIGAEVIYYHASLEKQVLVTRFIAGTNISPELAAEPEMLRRIVATVRLYHQGPAFPGTFSPFATVRAYHQLALAQGVALPETLPLVFELLARIEEALGPLQQPRPCHNDLLASNFIDDGQSIRVVDWEYAGMGDRFFDLGNFAVNQSLTEQQCLLLLELYFGEVRSADLAHLHLMRLASDLRESFWGFLQLGVSELSFDYYEYALHHLTRFLHNADTPAFAHWLQDVRA